MLLQSIVSELDRHLDRLVALRKIIAGLEKTPSTLRNLPVDLPTVLNAMPAPRDAPERLTKRRKLKSLRKALTPKNKIVPELAPLVMSRSIPAGPVVVSPRQLEEERQRRLTPQLQSVVAVAELEDLDQMSRSLSARWFVGSVQ